MASSLGWGSWSRHGWRKRAGQLYALIHCSWRRTWCDSCLKFLLPELGFTPNLLFLPEVASVRYFLSLDRKWNPEGGCACPLCFSKNIAGPSEKQHEGLQAVGKEPVDFQNLHCCPLVSLEDIEGYQNWARALAFPGPVHSWCLEELAAA